jgi:Holliday junction resolvase RusA-like endonuclease
MNPSMNERHRFGAIAGVRGAPCSANRMWKRAKQGHLYLSDAASAWEMAVATDVRTQMDTRRLKRWWVEAGQPQLRVSVTFYGVRGDIDNYLKTTLDGLKHAIGIDDKYYSPIEAHLGEKLRADGSRQPQGARIEITGASAVGPEIVSDPASDPDDDPDDDLPPAATQQPGSVWDEAIGWRAADLVDDDVLAKLRTPVTHVSVLPTDRYDAIFLMVPGLADNHGEWGAFLTHQEARELRELLNGLPQLQATTLAEVTPAAATVARGGR